MSKLGTSTNEIKAPLENGSYVAKIERIEEIKDSKFGPAFPFIFLAERMMGEDGWEDLDEPTELRKFISAPKGKIAPNTALYQVASAALKRDLEEGEELDTVDLEGKKVVISVEKAKKGDAWFSNIKTFAPFKTKKEPVTAGAGGSSTPTAEPTKPKSSRPAPDLD